MPQSEDTPNTGPTDDNENQPDDIEPDLVTTACRGKGGIPKAVLDWSVRQFVSQYCKGSINGVLPGQFEGVSIRDVLDLASGGDAAAKTCAKLLKEGRFRK